MAWTDIDPYRVRKLFNQNDFAALKGNVEYLQRPNVATYHHPGTGANYTITGELGQDLDTTNFSLNLTTYGGLVKAYFYGQFKVNAQPNSLRVNIIHVDTVSHTGRNLFYNYAVEIKADSTLGQPRGWIQTFPGLPAGSHTFRVVWGISPSAGTGTCMVAYRPRLTVVEYR